MKVLRLCFSFYLLYENLCARICVKYSFFMYQAIFRMKIGGSMIILCLTVRTNKTLHQNGWEHYTPSRTWVLSSPVLGNSCGCLFFYSIELVWSGISSVVFTCISLMTSGAKHLFTCFLIISRFLLRTAYSDPSPNF